MQCSFKEISWESKKFTRPNGQTYKIRKDGRKEDLDGFVCASGTPGSRNPWWFCVSVKITPDGVGVRDTKDTKKTTLNYTHKEWEIFVAGVKNGEFDLPKN